MVVARAFLQSSVHIPVWVKESEKESCTLVLYVLQNDKINMSGSISLKQPQNFNFYALFHRNESTLVTELNVFHT